jgi:two-component system cell cycle sensor histidine kinase PleC
MSSYFRYIAVFGFVLVLGLSFAAGLVFHKQALEQIIKNPTMAMDKKIATYYTQALWCRFAPEIAATGAETLPQWQATTLSSRLAQHSRTLFGVLSAAKISVYLPTPRALLFSTNEHDMVLFGEEEAASAGFFETAKQVPHARVLSSAGLVAKDGTVQKGAFLHSAMLISSANCPDAKPEQKPVTAVLEIYRDISMQWNYLYIFQAAISGGIVAIFLLLYLAVFVTSRKTERIIERQHEENISLAEAKARAELQSSEKSMFLANVTHELRTPLNAVIGFSEILKSEAHGPLGDPQYKEYVNDIFSSGTHLLSLINDILDYSKAEAQKLDVESVEIDLSKIGQSCLRLVETRARDANVSLINDIPERRIVLHADPKRMRQVILNLLSNSVKFTPENGKVTLLIREDIVDGLVRVQVKDSGIGIAPKDISRALAPFGQIDSSLSRRYEGTGLGLPLTKKLTEIMGGTFLLESEEGLGTSVTLSFPLRREEKKSPTNIHF